MVIKTGGLLEKSLKIKESKVCRNCENLIQVSNTALGCVAHDKLIMPDYLPYNIGNECNEWREKGEGQG